VPASETAPGQRPDQPRRSAGSARLPLSEFCRLLLQIGGQRTALQQVTGCRTYGSMLAQIVPPQVAYMPSSSNFCRVLHLPLGAIAAVVLPAAVSPSHLFTSWALRGNRFNG
jgi:hypothetical protein